MFRIRYFLPGSLSFEPLGTTFIMYPNAIFVNPNRTTFLRKYFVCHHAFTGV